jgi:SAM-dependent methyltransferase
MMLPLGILSSLGDLAAPLLPVERLTGIGFAAIGGTVQLEMVSRACPICGREDYAVFAEAAFDATIWDSFAFSSRKTPEYMHYRLLECRVCDVLYANPLPTRESLEQAYRDASFDSSEEAHFASLTYAQFLPDIVARISRPKAALDIGTGDGAFLEQLGVHGFERVMGVEPSLAPVQAAKPSIRPLIRQGPFRSEDFEAGTLSLVTCFQTMEHVYDPLALCRAAFDLLHDGGAIYLVCHDRRAWSARLLGNRSPIFDIEHLQLFSSKSLRYALTRAGFADVEIRTVTNRYPLHYWFRLVPMPGSLKAPLLQRLKGSRLGAFPIEIAAGNLAAIGYKRSRS